jgi:hypothetical protein
MSRLQKSLSIVVLDTVLAIILSTTACTWSDLEAGGPRAGLGAEVQSNSLLELQLPNAALLPPDLRLAVRAPERTRFVIYDADGWQLGTSNVGPDFAIDYSFNQLGVRSLRATAFGPTGEVLGSVTRSVELVDGATVRFSELEDGDVWVNGGRLRAIGTPDVAAVRFEADGWLLDEVLPWDAAFDLSYDFLQDGPRRVTAIGLDGASQEIARAEVTIVVEAPVTPQVRILAPWVSGGEYANPVWLTAEVEGDIAGLRWLDETGVEIGRSENAEESFALLHRFDALGTRTIQAEAYDPDLFPVATDERTVVVVEQAPAPEAAPPASSGVASVPYFYQYNNAISPGATCQNTSIAMLLARYGWTGTPDDITAEFGRFYAQSPAGLAALFNTLARRASIGARLTADTSATVGELRALLQAGKPVIIHGYMTSSGHVVVATGFDGTHYTANDPAGMWNQVFNGGYPTWDQYAGRGVRYGKGAFEAAVGTSNGSNPLPLWIHVLSE